MSRAVKLILLIAVISGLYWAYGHWFGHGPDQQAGGAPPVGVAEVIQRDTRQWKEFSGRLVAVDQADIRPRVAGTIEAIHFQNGARVKKDAPLFTIDPKPFEAALMSAKAKYALADAEFKRAQTLLEAKAIAQRDFDQRKNNVDVAKADYTKAALDLGYTKVKSPIAGRAGRAEITVGNLVDGSVVLTSVVSSNPIYADFEIDEASYLQYARDGAAGDNARQIPVRLALDGLTRDGRVESFDNRLNTASGTVRVRAIIDNADGALVPGLFARVSVSSANPEKLLLITDRAVGTDQSKKFVIVVGEDGKTEHRDVVLDGQADGLRIVREGLKPGEKIIVSGLQRVMMPGQPVTPELVPMPGTDDGLRMTDDEENKQDKPSSENEPQQEPAQ